LYTRFIPAGAGNRVSSRYLPRRTTVHPRGCGERAGSKGRTVNVYGSSPRVRGTDGVTYRCEAGVRFIPAGAGNGCREPACRNRTTVHPRGCGERNRHNKSFHRTAGSSPRVRGTDGEIIHPLANQRFIPARAGNRMTWLISLKGLPVHPRPCGEQGFKVSSAVINGGSSPPVRGTVDTAGGKHRFYRFIPARAGNRRIALIAIKPTTVHPRPCGEQCWVPGSQWPGCGSSPPVRGTDFFHCFWAFPTRFIPARAGNSAFRMQQHSAGAVHPRPCGEQPYSASPTSSHGGSSPPVRGTVGHVHVHGAVQRFIPARAGNSRRLRSSQGR